MDNNSPHTSFSSEYENLGYPVQGGIRNISISNGSECGTSLDFNPYDQIGHVDLTYLDLPFFIHNLAFSLANLVTKNPLKAVTSYYSTNTDIKADIDLRALPIQQSKEIYKGKIFVSKKVLGFINIEEPLIDEKTLNSSSSMLPLDNASGGIYDINSFNPLPSNITQFIFEQRFNLVPTFSSLDIGGGTQPIATSDLSRSYSPVAPPVTPKDVPFDNFTTNPTISELHVQFTLENGNWLLDELQGNEAFYTCASSCAVIPEPQIAGVDVLCTSNEVFSLSGLPAGTSASWTASPGSLFAVDNGSGTSFTTRASSSSSSGTGTITATINGDCGNIPGSKDIQVGAPNSNDINIIQIGQYYPGGSEICADQSNNAIAVWDGDGAVSEYSWYTGNWSIQNYPISPDYTDPMQSVLISAYANPYDDPVGIQVRAKNTCGWGAYEEPVILDAIDCYGYRLKLSPNPATTEVTVSIEDDQGKAPQGIKADYDVSIVNTQGMLAYKSTKTTHKFTISLMNVKPGMYIVRVSESKKVYSGMLRVEK